MVASFLKKAWPRQAVLKHGILFCRLDGRVKHLPPPRLSGLRIGGSDG
ncbi:MAG: hypothetical protein QW797_02810 [Thermoproteota archaeon]